MKSGIYEIVSPSGRRYIGSAVDITGRWATHRSRLRSGAHHCAGLQSAFKKYAGELDYRVVERCSIDLLLVREQFHIDSHGLRNLYNSAPIAGNCPGLRHSDGSKAKMSKAKRGVPHSAEHRAAVADAKRKQTPATISKIKATLAGRITNPDALVAARAANLGRALTDDHKRKIREGNLGKTRSPETRQKQANIRRGRKHSEATLAKLRVPCSTEKAEKIRQTQLRRSAAKRAASQSCTMPTIESESTR